MSMKTYQYPVVLVVPEMQVSIQGNLMMGYFPNNSEDATLPVYESFESSNKLILNALSSGIVLSDDAYDRMMVANHSIDRVVFCISEIPQTKATLIGDLKNIIIENLIIPEVSTGKIACEVLIEAK